MNKYKDSKRINHSSLSYFQISPKVFKSYIDKGIEDKTEKYLELGKQLHMYVLEPNAFEEKYTFFDFQLPSTEQQKAFCNKFIETNDYIESYKFAYSMKGKSDDKIDKEAKKLLAILGHYISYLKTTEEGRIVLPNKTQNYLDEAKNALKQHIKARELLFQSDSELLDPDLEIYNEFQIDWIDPFTNLECKSLIDRLIIDHKNKVIKLIDLKTTYTFKEFEFKIFEFNYHRQLAFYRTAIEYYLIHNQGLTLEELNNYSKEIYIIAVTTTGNIEVKVFPISYETISSGYNAFNKILKDIKWHVDMNLWDYTRSYYNNEGLEEAI